MKGKGRLEAPLLLMSVVLLLCSLLASCTTAGPSVTTATPTSTPHLHAGLNVVGNHIETSDGKTLVYHGVNRSGTEYQCTKSGQGVFDGPSDQASISAMLTWKINIVRVPLNEDCWLGINGEPASGLTMTQYRQDVVNYVHLLRQNNLVVIVELHWSAPGSQQALGQQPMPDADHAPAFWSSVASTFKDDPFIIFEMYNEPYTTIWQCWRDGSSGANAKPCTDVGFAVAGMQTLINTVRSTGAINVILVGGINYSNNMYGWILFKPHDPANNLAATLHVYANNGCNNTDCLDNSVAPVAAKYPVLADEIGEFDCGDSFINSIMSWLDSHQIGYLAWAWDVQDCSNFPALISSYDGTATAYGLGFKNHLSSL
jgi:hypothetical protein